MNRKSDGWIPRATVSKSYRTGDTGIISTRGFIAKSSTDILTSADILKFSSCSGCAKESLSLQSRTTDSNGNLPLHIFCAQKYPLEVELLLLRNLLELNPRAVTQKDLKGNLPIHIAVDQEDARVSVVEQLLLYHSKAAEVKNNAGDFPIFLACRKNIAKPAILLALLRASGEMAFKVSYGCLPLHQLVHCRTPSVEALKIMINANPAAAATTNKHGNLPLHLLCAGQPGMDAFLVLLQAFPSAICARNVRGETPVSKAIQVQKSSTSIGQLDTDYVRMMLRFSAVHTLDEEEKSILRELNWKARRTAVLLSVKDGNVTGKGAILSYLHSAMPGVWRDVVSMI